MSQLDVGESKEGCLKRRLTGRWKRPHGRLRDLLNFAIADARRAHADTLASALYQRAHALQIDVPAALGDVMSVADAVTELRPATTYFANLCHKTEIS